MIFPIPPSLAAGGRMGKISMLVCFHHSLATGMTGTMPGMTVAQNDYRLIGSGFSFV